MINICLLFGIFPSSIRDEIEGNSKGAVQYAADALQKSIIAGITKHCDDVSIVNLPFISSYPKYYKRLIAPSGFVEPDLDGVQGASLSYINIPILKFWSKEKKALNGLVEWGESKKDKKVIIIYSAHSPLIKAAVKYKKKYDKEAKIILVLPDLPEFMAQKRTFIVEQMKRIDEKSIWKLYADVDGYILLTEFMKERLPINDKPYRVIEGIFNPKDQQPYDCKTKKTIFYGGTLAKRYGVMNLVNAFIKADIPDFTLEICGMGDSKEKICNLASTHPNIRYLGLLKREDALRRQMEASLLVNPRTPEGEFTRYSFPSKTMEYLASGVPTLLYKLPGIPAEYYDFCFTISELGVDALAGKLKEILSLSDEERKEIGKKAKNYILTKKNPVEQCSKLYDLIIQVTAQ